MSKNAEGWIRHNNKKQPVDDHVEVEIRTRGGDYEVCKAYDFAWDATGEHQIMAYRLHKPAEQPKPFIEAVQAFNALAKVPQLDGPLQWRDRIAEIDVDIKFEEDRYNANMACMNQERAELVQKLASEGFALIGRIVELLTEAAQKHEDMGDPKNWREGDIFLQTAKNIHGAAEGELWTMTEDDGTTAKRYTRQNGDSWYVSDSHLCFHSRPSS